MTRLVGPMVGPIRTIAGDRQPSWPQSIVGARCPRCGRWVGRIVVHMVPDPLGLGDEVIDFVSGTCAVHGVVIARDWRALS